MALERDTTNKRMGWSALTDRGPFGFNMGSPDGIKAEAQSISTALAAPGQFAATGAQNFGNYANAFTGYMQGLAGLSNSQANNYGAYASGLGNLAIAQANAQNNNQLLNTGYNSMAEAARQGALANLGSAALGAYGSASGAAQNAWAQNQGAYNAMLSNLGAANQSGLSQLGQSRNNALSNLGNAYSRAGIGLAVANALPAMDFGGGDGGFSATGPEGEVASGSYGGMSRRPAAGTQDGARMFGGLDATRADLNSTDIADRMDRNYAGAVDVGTLQHMSSREMPSQMLGQTLAGLMALNDRNVGASSRGMDQYYANVTPIQNRDRVPINVQDVLSGLTYGYGDSSDRLGGIQRQMGAGFDDVGTQYTQTGAALRDLFDSSIGKLDLFRSPLDRAQRARAADLYNQRLQLEDWMHEWQNSPLHPDFVAGQVGNLRKQIASLPVA